MLFAGAVAALALAAQALAEPVPYKAPIMKMSLSQLGLVRRDDGYTPQQTQCGTGNTCAEACGAGYQTCASNDQATHCYNPAANESCCPDGSGNSCQAGYYCTHDTANTVICCPNGMGLAACAAAYSAKGSLVSETPTPTASSTTSSSSMPITSASAVPTTSSFAPSVGLSSALPTNGTTSSFHSSSPTATTSTSASTVPTSGANAFGPALSVAGVMAAGLFALVA